MSHFSGDSPPTTPAVAQWCARIKSIQESRSPEEVADYKRRAETVKRSSASVMSASRMQRKTAYSEASTCLALGSASGLGGGSAPRTTWASAQVKQESQLARFSGLPSGDSEEGADEENALVSELAGELALTSPVLAAALAERGADPDSLRAVASAELQQLLEQFATEPTNDEESEAKFKLYEAFAKSSKI
jgi:hypothetical protein